ncbi:MAG: class I SAM-dependent methyltransferase [Methylomonas sp.]|nr:class I SAM-dependent methyltransferase [Methylomonas sp.]
MNTELFTEAKIIESWRKNTLPWTVAVRKNRIESRKLITNQAIVDTILDRSPRSVIDIGCGEGWLVHELAVNGIDVIGLDGAAAFIEAAQHAGVGDFRVMSYEDIAYQKLGATVDIAVCNFSLFGKDSVEGIFKKAPSLLNSRGSLIVQTLHPIISCGDLPYRDGWREGSWAGFSCDFSDPAPWYFRTIESWISLFVANGFRLSAVREPIHPTNQRPASIIFVGEMPD